MTPPLRLRLSFPAPLVPANDRPELQLAPELRPNPGFTLAAPRYGSAPAFRLPSLFAIPAPLPAAETSEAAAAAPLRFVDFLPAIYALAEGVEAMDLDVERVPVNRGSGLCRYSEYTPRSERPADCSLTVYPNTRARVHGEVRPIRGREESLITRFSVDFTPNVFNAAPINPLEIDGFGGVDAPELGYDLHFSGRSPVLSMSGGDFGYENAFAEGSPWRTPFDSEAAPPPNRDFMIRFAPVESTVLSVVQRAVGESRLMLWAFLPTLGIYEPEGFADLGIRFNTMPRRFGDLLRLFSPLFDRERGRELRQAAPYLNPNSEVLLEAEELAELNAERVARGEEPLVGLRQPLPLDRAENIRWAERRTRLNEARLRAGLLPFPAITTNRGPVIDWIFSDLARDPARLATLADADLPAAEIRARLRETRLSLPMGELTLRAGTEIHVRYFLERVEHPVPGQSPVRMAVDIRVEPVEIEGLRLEFSGTALEAESLAARSVEVQLRFPVMTDAAADAPAAEIGLNLAGVEAENFHLDAEELGLEAELGQARFDSLSFTRRADGGLRAEWTGLEAETASLSHPSLHLQLGRLSVPTLSLEREVAADGEPGPLRIRVPDLSLEDIDGGGRVPLVDGNLRLRDGEIELGRGRSVFEGELDLRGSFPNGFSEGPLSFGNFSLQPSIEDLHIQGRARVELQAGGWSLRRSEGAGPLSVNFRIGPSWLSHRPHPLPDYLSALPAARSIETRVEIRSAEVRVEDLQEVEFRQVAGPEGRRGRLEGLRSGPISVHHVEGGGRIWVGLPIWGWVRGLFPELGGRATGTAPRVDLSPLVRHLSDAARTLLGDGDFMRIGGVDLHRDPEGGWRTQIDDLIFSLRESGGRGQFGGLRIPRFVLESRAEEDGEARTLFELDPHYWANIYLNDPDRGGSFRFVRWPERP